MCECGCTSCCTSYRLPIDETSCFTIDLYPGCKDCSAAPGVIVRKVEASSFWWDEAQDAPLFPFAPVDGFLEGAIKCGLDPDDFRKAAVQQMAGTSVKDDDTIDEDLAEILADDIWGDCVKIRPEVIEYKAS